MNKLNKNLDELVDEFKNEKFYFEPLSGNNGDKLIEMGAEYFIKSKDLYLVRDPQAADVILINGSGGMTKDWGAFDTALNYINTYLDKTIIILPSSWNLDEDSFKKINQDRLKNI